MKGYLKGMHRGITAMSTIALALAITTAAVRADDFLDKVKAAAAALTNPQTTWTGPTDGPKADPGKFVVYVAQDEQNDAAVQYGNAIKEAATKVGWKFLEIDGRGTASGAIEGTNQAIALKADAIIISADAAPAKDAMLEAHKRGIVVVGIHAAAETGPKPEWGMAYNIQGDPKSIGIAEADWVIANSNGKANVVVTTDCSAGIACTKATATKDEIEKCTGCKVVEFNSSPFSEAQQRQPALTAAWVQRFGTPLYITSVADYIADFQAPALRAGGVDPKSVILVSSDGGRSGYDRIRAGNQYQQVTVPEPIGLQGYQAIDEVNRALHNLPPSGFQLAPFLVAASNIHAEGGDNDGYDPSNNYRDHYAQIWGVK